jgi:hypothetical protein
MEWQARVVEWQCAFPDRVTLCEWPQFASESGSPQVVRGLTLGDDGHERPVRLLVTVPHAHEPAPTAAILDLAAQLITGRRWDGSAASPKAHELASGHGQLLLTLLPDTNSQGRARSPRLVWDGAVHNEAFLKVAFGEAAGGVRFGRYPEWRLDDYQPRSVGIIYEEIEPGLLVEPNTSRRSTHSRAIDELFHRYGYTHYLEMHQHEGDEAVLLPPDFDTLTPEQQARLTDWGGAMLDAWEGAGITHKGSYVPYRGLPRLELFREFWRDRCPGMLRLSTETRNNRHSSTGAATTMERQFRSAAAALEATLSWTVGQAL